MDGAPIEERPAGRLGLGVRTLLAANGGPEPAAVAAERPPSELAASEASDPSAMAVAVETSPVLTGPEPVEPAKEFASPSASLSPSSSPAAPLAAPSIGRSAGLVVSVRLPVGAESGPAVVRAQPDSRSTAEESGVGGMAGDGAGVNGPVTVGARGPWIPLLVADGVLCGLAAVVMLHPGVRVGVGVAVLAAGAVVTGAWLACEALLGGRRLEGSSGGVPAAVAVPGPVRPERAGLFRSSVPGGAGAHPGVKAVLKSGVNSGATSEANTGPKAG